MPKPQTFSQILNPLEDVVLCGANAINVFADALNAPRSDEFYFDDIKFVKHKWLRPVQIVTGNKDMIEAMKRVKENNQPHNGN